MVARNEIVENNWSIETARIVDISPISIYDKGNAWISSPWKYQMMCAVESLKRTTIHGNVECRDLICGRDAWRISKR